MVVLSVKTACEYEEDKMEHFKTISSKSGLRDNCVSSRPENQSHCTTYQTISIDYNELNHY